MGICLSCCEDSSGSERVVQPSVEERRQLQAEAAQRRMQDNSARGVADPAHVQRQQKKREDYERALEQSYPSDREGGLRWTAG